jgi:multicomponent Na+:H+ antiporter subunit D
LAGVYIFAQTLHHGHQVLHIGSWQAPYGITFVADILTGIMLTITALVALLVMIYSLSSVDSERQKGGFFILAQGLLMGVNGAFLTGDIFNLYVWFEVMLTSSFVLITLGATKGQLRGSIKYVVLNLIASVFFVAAIGLMYGKTGTLNMADLAFKLRMSESAFVTNSSFMLFLLLSA